MSRCDASTNQALSPPCQKGFLIRCSRQTWLTAVHISGTLHAYDAAAVAHRNVLPGKSMVIVSHSSFHCPVSMEAAKHNIKCVLMRGVETENSKERGTPEPTCMSLPAALVVHQRRRFQGGRILLLSFSKNLPRRYCLRNQLRGMLTAGVTLGATSGNCAQNKERNCLVF